MPPTRNLRAITGYPSGQPDQAERVKALACSQLHSSRDPCELWERVKALACSQRKARGALKNVKEERTRMFDYCMPYVFLPHKQREDDIPDTCVDVMCELPGRQAPLVFDYDWDMDTVDEFVDEKEEDEQKPLLAVAIQDSAEDEALEDEQKPVLATAIKEAIEDLGETVRQRLERVRVLKFYPQNPLLSPDSRTQTRESATTRNQE
ncbi:hypothetical protein T484DRAFT_1777343 [Baffinella frigidus]|nr:hypothetical protein T484DRAFT_1777343 [Cryptophyta sp. CCMP2293]